MKKSNILINRLKSNSLIGFLIDLKGNPKVLIFLEPLWGIPFNLINPFASLFMREIGLKDFQIGSLQSVFIISQMIVGIFSAAIADKYGRKKATFIGDIVGWTVAMNFFAFSQNYYMFVIGYTLNGVMQIAHIGWNCFMSEDVDSRKILNIQNWIMISGLISVVLAPLSGLFINKFGLVIVIRILYGSHVVTMFFKSFLTYKLCTETSVGIEKIKENKNNSIFYLARKNYSFQTIVAQFSDFSKLRVLIFQTIFAITVMITSTFVNIYAKEQLGIPAGFFSIAPIIRAVIMLVFMFFIQSKMKNIKNPMLIGLFLYIMAQITLMIIPSKNLMFFITYTILEAISYALVFPRKNSMEVFALDKNHRAREVSLIRTFTLVLSSPFGFIAGQLSEFNPVFPFILNIVLFIAGFVLIFTMKEPAPLEEI